MGDHAGRPGAALFVSSPPYYPAAHFNAPTGHPASGARALHTDRFETRHKAANAAHAGICASKWHRYARLDAVAADSATPSPRPRLPPPPPPTKTGLLPRSFAPQKQRLQSRRVGKSGAVRASPRPMNKATPQAETAKEWPVSATPDKSVNCKDCSTAFVFTGRESELTRAVPGYAHQPPACRTNRRHRAACPEAPRTVRARCACQPRTYVQRCDQGGGEEVIR